MPGAPGHSTLGFQGPGASRTRAIHHYDFQGPGAPGHSSLGFQGSGAPERSSVGYQKAGYKAPMQMQGLQAPDLADQSSSPRNQLRCGHQTTCGLATCYHNSNANLYKSFTKGCRRKESAFNSYPVKSKHTFRTL